MDPVLIPYITTPDPGTVRCPYCRTTGYCQTSFGALAKEYHADRRKYAWACYEASLTFKSLWLDKS